MRSWRCIGAVTQDALLVRLHTSGTRQTSDSSLCLDCVTQQDTLPLLS